ncbi:MAG: 1-deoxy-D-xylulose-5-phosphate synthase N-terminal domain-containing protein [Desulfobacteraceae bacterium]|jgi:transketolase|nr:1-deoxy-D-xylulose-5-phosphate synthase N-terminal domain-containing protein [Desulfobacteraceae bacterium]
MIEIRLIPINEFQRVREANIDKYARLALISDMCSANALATVKRAGSGHLGSSFSSLDVVTYLYHHEMNIAELGVNHPDRDIYFSSKGHDVPGHYAVLHSLGLLAEERFQHLRRLDGTHGHPDISIAGIEANSGSLGMGISKAKGMALAKKMSGAKGRVMVMTGDGELQEGQIWESLQTAAYQKVNNLIAIVDYNKIQTDKSVKDIIDLGDLTRKFEAFGWHAQTCDGHDFAELESAFTQLKQINDRPKALIADTIKGKGVSFMEGPRALQDGNGLYPWHSGAPDDEKFEAGHGEIVNRINARLEKLDLAPLKTRVMATRERNRVTLKDTAEKVVTAYGNALVRIGAHRKDIVVLDADLSADCGLRPFEKAYPDRFIENGIAEQDMVSTAGGLALQGFLPIVNSFGVFLASRSNEQIYNNATEKTKIIYVCHYAGLIPAGPGKSHQSLRDISLFGALPNCTIIEPCNGFETEQALEWCVNHAEHNCMLRLIISPSPRSIVLPDDYHFSPGKGTTVSDGNNAVLFTYGPVMLHEALTAGELLKKDNFSLKVINFPWLNRVDIDWLEEIIAACDLIFSLDNHSQYGGLGDSLLNACMSSKKLQNIRLLKFAIEDFPACGTPQEVLGYHKLDGPNLATRILSARDTN